MLALAAGCGEVPERRLDPIFGKQTPLLFAHRGGARERPESTPLAFRYALADPVRADVLEIDVHVTAPGPTHGQRLVVWHGPGLGNVRIEGLPDRPDRRPTGRDEIHELSWGALDGRAWVADFATDHPTLENVPRDPERRVLLLSEMLGLFPDAAINIELKRSFGALHIPRLLEILREHRGARTLLVVSVDCDILQAFRAADPAEVFPTGLCAGEATRAWLRGLIPFGSVPERRAVQIPHQAVFSSRRYVRKLHSAASSVHVFITGFFGPGLDDPGPPEREEIFEILDRGVDGIMTDWPGVVRQLIDAWVADGA